MSVIEVIEGVSRKDMEKMKSMVDVESACIEAKVDVPEEVMAFLELDHEVIGKLRPGIDRGVSSESSDGFETIEIDLSKIDKEIDIIRITKNW